MDATSGTFNPFSNILDMASCLLSWKVNYKQIYQTSTAYPSLNPGQCSMGRPQTDH